MKIDKQDEYRLKLNSHKIKILAYEKLLEDNQRELQNARNKKENILKDLQMLKVEREIKKIKNEIYENTFDLEFERSNRNFKEELEEIETKINNISNLIDSIKLHQSEYFTQLKQDKSKVYLDLTDYSDYK